METLDCPVYSEGHETLPYRVALCWSSSQPTMKVLFLAVGQDDISSTEGHASFIRWVEGVKHVPRAGMSFYQFNPDWKDEK